MDTVTELHVSPPSDITPSAFLPAEAPTEMTAQSLRLPAKRQLGAPPRSVWPRRALILAGTGIMTVAGCDEMYEVLNVGGVTVLEAIVLGLFVLLFAWVAFSFMSAMAGFAVLLVRRKDQLGIDPAAALPTITTRVAMLLPTYNEDPYRVLARLRAICESVEQTGRGSHFDWFVLSDTTDPAIWIAEEKAFLRLRADVESSRLFYRHRPQNTARKSGNIEDWVKRFGAGYETMLILDADSLMTGDTIVRLAGAMDDHQAVGLIQTLPMVVNARTRFARLQQFAGRLYGPLIAAGIAWWHGSEGNYWGHNAIIRVRAFADSAGLPELGGRKPFGGHILSHDFVEAALMRRAGWEIRMAATLGGSYEECPPTLLDFAIRDRRWCQGNLQHAAVLTARGLHWVSRLHFLTGIGSYLTAPLWFMFLLLGIMISLQAQFVRPEYFPKGFSLFPQWPAQDPVLAKWVFAGTMAMLLVPKMLAYLLVLTQPEMRKRFGGGLMTLAGVLVETLLSGLTAPVMMIFQSSAVAEILLGRDAGWQVQRRDDGAVSARETLRNYAVPSIFGIAMAGSAYAVSLPLLFWMTPVILGLVLAVPIALMSSGTGTGPTGRLFRTPEEAAPPQVLLRANQLAKGAHEIGCPLRELRDDRVLRTAHLANLSDRQPRRRGIVDPRLAIARAKIEDAISFDEAVTFLSRGEIFAVLNSAGTLETLLDFERPQGTRPPDEMAATYRNPIKL